MSRPPRDAQPVEGPGLYLRLTRQHSSVLTTAANLAGVKNTEMLRRMIEFWDETHPNDHVAGHLSQVG